MFFRHSTYVCVCIYTYKKPRFVLMHSQHISLWFWFHAHFCLKTKSEPVAFNSMYWKWALCLFIHREHEMLCMDMDMYMRVYVYGVCVCVPFSPRALNMYALHKRQHNLSKALHRICFCFEIYLNELEATEDIASSFSPCARYLAFTPEL